MKNKQKNGKKSYIYIIFLALAFIILLGTGAYAYYQTTISGTISGTVSKWSFKANNQTSTLSLDLGSLYPGAYIEHDLELSAEDSDLDVYYELIFHDLPTSMRQHLYYVVNNDWCGFSNPDACVGAYGIIPAGGKVTIPVIFEWIYDNGVDDSTLANGNKSSVSIKIKAQQYTGYNGTIPMDLFNLSSVNSSTDPFGNIGSEYDGYFYDSYYFMSNNSTSGIIGLNLGNPD